MKFGISVSYERLRSKPEFRENRLSESRTESEGCGRIAILTFAFTRLFDCLKFSVSESAGNGI
jgi:hypothetical protein